MAEDLSAYAELDLGRAQRRGYPEAIYCAGKTPEQVAGIADAVRSRPEVITLFTRARAEHAEAVLRELPTAFHDADAGLLAWPPEPPAVSGGLVVVLAAGTSDLAVAREAQLTARYLGRETELVVDVGVAGLHRVLGRLELLRRARVVVVAAGMDGALPSVVAGLIAAPVVAVPTSVGYGAAFEGLAALLAMLNACSPGVAVVNIDNGYGAGHLAAQIAAPQPDAAQADTPPGLALPSAAATSLIADTQPPATVPPATPSTPNGTDVARSAGVSAPQGTHVAGPAAPSHGTQVAHVASGADGTHVARTAPTGMPDPAANPVAPAFTEGDQ